MSEFYNIKITINKELSAIRLDKVLTKKIDKFSRSQIKILIQNGIKFDGSGTLMDNNDYTFSSGKAMSKLNDKKIPK